MARRTLSAPTQPLLVRCALRTYEFLASLKLAVVLILLVAIVLGVATFVEAHFGTAAVGFLLYHTWFFSALLSVLAVNIFCAASIRFPWKRHQTGFVVTHIGLLSLLAGSAISDRGSVNSQMLVYLGQSSRVAIDRDQSLISVANIPGRPEPLQVRFQPGPFNWSDLAPYPIVRRLKSWVGLDDPAKTWTHPSQVLYDEGGTKVEVVDFYSRSEVRRTPFLALRFDQPKLKMQRTVDLEFGGEHPDLPFASASFGEMGRVLMWQTADADGPRSLKECIPDRGVEGDGLVCFWWKGESYAASVVELRKLKEAKKRFKLDDRISVEMNGYAQSADLQALVQGKGLTTPSDASEGRTRVGPAVELYVYEKTAAGETKFEIVRFAELPFVPYRKRPPGFYAELYHPSMAGRIDVVVGPDDKLAYRAWQKKLGRVVSAGDLALGTTVDTWSMGGGDMVWKMTPTRFLARDPSASDKQRSGKESQVVLPLPFDKGDTGDSKRVRMRISWTDPKSGSARQDSFWLKQNLPEPWPDPQRGAVHDTPVADEKPIRTSYDVKETDVGFAVELADFDLEVDPGTKMAANYTSHIVQADVRDEAEVRRLRTRISEEQDPARRQRLRDELSAVVQKRTDEALALIQGKSPAERAEIIKSNDALQDHVITMNRPLDYPDPQGRQLRFFQENYLPPDKARQTPLASIFRVNYDPGRPVKYLGSGLIVFGIFLMFYMRAYFFNRPAKGAVQ